MRGCALHERVRECRSSSQTERERERETFRQEQTAETEKNIVFLENHLCCQLHQDA